MREDVQTVQGCGGVRANLRACDNSLFSRLKCACVAQSGRQTSEERLAILAEAGYTDHRPATLPGAGELSDSFSEVGSSGRVGRYPRGSWTLVP